MADSSKPRRTRRRFDSEFNEQAVRLVLDEGKSVAAVARDLDLTETALREWVKRTQADRTKGRTGLTTAEREELARLRKENRMLQEERETSKKRWPSSPSTSDEVCLHRRGEGQAFGDDPLSVSPREPQRVLRLAATRTVRPGAAGSRLADEAARVPCRQRASLWAAALVEGPDGGRRGGQRKARQALDAGRADSGRVKKRFKQTTNSDHEDPVAANLLDRDFTALATNQRWVGDTTEFVIGENAKLYLAAILDLYSRFVVGWAVSAVNDRRLTLKALAMAVQRRCPEPGLLHHSDRGCTHTCEDYERYLASRGITCSMSRRADCYDNAVMDSFFVTVKKEEAERFPSYSEAKMALFDYIEVFYNQRRRHSTLGQISPAAFERGAAA
jgi:transposase InsO family protein/transposase-like protein